MWRITEARGSFSVGVSRTRTLHIRQTSHSVSNLVAFGRLLVDVSPDSSHCLSSKGSFYLIPCVYIIGCILSLMPDLLFVTISLLTLFIKISAL